MLQRQVASGVYIYLVHKLYGGPRTELNHRGKFSRQLRGDQGVPLQRPNNNHGSYCSVWRNGAEERDLECVV